MTRYLLTYVYSPEEADYDFLIGANGDVPCRMERYLPSVIFPGKAWINGEPVVSLSSNEQNARKTVRLKKGFSTVLLELVQPQGKRIEGFAVFQPAGEPSFFDPYVPRLRWFVKPCNLTYHIKPQWTEPVGWYRFQAPPGLRSMRFSLKAKSVTAWIDGKPVGVTCGARPGDLPWEAIVSLGTPTPRMSQVVLRVDQVPGLHEGAAFSSPVTFDCDRGEIPLGDWCEYGLQTYSGCGVYAKTVTLGPQHVNSAVILDLGDVATLADVRVNGTDAGVRLARPYEIDISRLVRVGSNTIEVTVANTLANHMSTYPTRHVYPGQTRSGLLGPVRLRFSSKLRLATQGSAEQERVVRTPLLAPNRVPPSGCSQFRSLPTVRGQDWRIAPKVAPRDGGRTWRQTRRRCVWRRPDIASGTLRPRAREDPPVRSGRGTKGRSRRGRLRPPRGHSSAAASSRP